MASKSISITPPTISSSSSPLIVQHRGLDLTYPIKPYPSQAEFSQLVLDCFLDGKHGLLESPTGTGKTMALLAAAIAYRSHPFGSQSLVIYASRTHGQLEQVIGQLKHLDRLTVRESPFRAGVVGSREQLCIHPQVQSRSGSSEKVKMCNSLVKSRQCQFYNNYAQMASAESDRAGDICDIEDLVKTHKMKKICPYFAARERSSKVDMLFMPYNYLLDASIRKTLNFQLKGSLVILDEAHNVMQVCEDSSSMTFEVKDVAVALHEVDVVLQFLDKQEPIEGINLEEISIESACLVKEHLVSLEEILMKYISEGTWKPGQTYPGQSIKELLTSSGLNSAIKGPFVAALQSLQEVLAVLSTLRGGQDSGRGLQVVGQLMELVYPENRDPLMGCHLMKYYRFHVESTKVKNNLKFHLWCFHSGFAMSNLRGCGIRSVILASGTLKPFNVLAEELDTHFEVQFSGPHVIGQDQCMVQVVPQGQDKVQLISTYQNRNNPKYLLSLGDTILEILNVTPHGVLIFFPSYANLTAMVDSWRSSGFWNKFEKAKRMLVEPKEKIAFEQVISEYRNRSSDDNDQSPCLLAVCRGKVAEGIDFSDRMARAVIVTGIPFPNLHDSRVQAKRNFLDQKQSRDKTGITGNEWYKVEAFRAVNQAIGRVIRHRNDFGAIMFLDKRFGDQQNRNNISNWVSASLRNNVDAREAIRALGQFYSKMQGTVKHMPRPQVPIVDRSNLIGNKRSSSSNPSTTRPVAIIPAPKKIKVTSTASNLLKYKTTTLVSRLKLDFTKDELRQFFAALKTYKEVGNLDDFIACLRVTAPKEKLKNVNLHEFEDFILQKDLAKFGDFCQTQLEES